MRVKQNLMEVTVQTNTCKQAHANKHITEKSLKFWCYESKQVDLKIREEELQQQRKIWVIIPWY